MSEVLIRHCAHCAKPVRAVAGGRPRRFCSSACKQAAYRARHTAERPLEEPVPAPGRWRAKPRPCRAYPDVASEGMEPYLVCPLPRGHEGCHCSLVGPAVIGPVTSWWARWEDKSWGWDAGPSSPPTLYYTCQNCILPHGHAGPCLDSRYVWTDVAPRLLPDRELDRMVRLRLSFPSPNIAVPRWHPRS